MLKSSFLFIILASVCFAQAVPIPSGKFSPKKYVSYKSAEALTIDGKMDETSWLKAEWTDDFMDIEGTSKPAPRFRTRSKMLWDDNYFYIAAEIQDPEIWGNLKNHDDIIFYDNDFEVFIDPDGDTHRYCEFEMNALNTVWELLLVLPYRDTKNAAINGWDIKGLKTGVAVNGTINEPGDIDKNWTVEIAFPWQAFKEIAETDAPPKNNDQWRINFSRVEWKTKIVENKYQKEINPSTGKPFPEDNWVWSPQGVVNMHYPEMWGYVQFSTEKVGNKIVAPVEKEDEEAKWFLRNIYYKEYHYRQIHDVFTNQLSELNLETRDIPGFSMPPVIECTTNMFEASLKSADGTRKLNIRNDGLVWITNIKK